MKTKGWKTESENWKMKNIRMEATFENPLSKPQYPLLISLFTAGPKYQNKTGAGSYAAIVYAMYYADDESVILSRLLSGKTGARKDESHRLNSYFISARLV